MGMKSKQTTMATNKQYTDNTIITLWHISHLTMTVVNFKFTNRSYKHISMTRYENCLNPASVLTTSKENQFTFLNNLQTDVFVGQDNWRQVFHHAVISTPHNYTAKILLICGLTTAFYNITACRSQHNIYKSYAN